MSLNDEQSAHLEALAENPELRCGCGWFFKAECQIVCPHPSKQDAISKAHLEGYQSGKALQSNMAIRALEQLIKVWGIAAEDQEKAAQGRMALFAALHEIRKQAPRS